MGAFACMQLYYGQLVTFLHMQTFQGGIQMDNLVVLFAIKKLVPIDYNVGENCHIGHHRFLPTNHKFRCGKRSFNGEEELRLPHAQLFGVDVLQQLEQLEPIILGKSKRKKMGKCYTLAQLEEK